MGTLTLEQIENILQQARDAGITSIYFEGGESFLYYAVLVKAIREAGKMGFSTPPTTPIPVTRLRSADVTDGNAFNNSLRGNTMLITDTDCITGRKYTTPVNLYRNNGHRWVMASRGRTRWRNARKSAKVSLLLDEQTLDAFADKELDETVVQSHWAKYTQHIPMAARLLEIRVEDNVPRDEDSKRVVRDRLFVRIRQSLT